MRNNRMRWGLALLVCLTTAGVAAAQDQATVPAPPPDQSSAAAQQAGQAFQQPAPTLQQPAQESQVRAVRLSAVKGKVQILEGGKVVFQQAEMNMPIVQGMKLVTSDDGRAEVQFEDGSVARVTPNSSITLAQLGRDDSGALVTVIDADSGLTYYELDGNAGRFAVRFGQDQIKIVPVDGSIFRLDLDYPPAELAVMHGSVQVSDNENLSMVVHTDQSVKFDPQSPDEYQLSQSVTAKSWDQWNSDRDEALAELASNETEQQANNAGAGNPAWSALDAYGDWYDVPGYGMGWTPLGVGANWDPYGLGAWGYYSGIGYTWISGYPWGWLPYRCGGWNWFNSFGWMWFPSGCGWGGVGMGMGFGGGWYPYSVILSAPHGYHPARLPKHFGRPGRNPVDHPHHGPVQLPKLITVDRGQKYTRQIHPNGVARVKPHMLFYDGRNIAPVRGGVHPVEKNGFTSVQRVNPGFGSTGPGSIPVYSGVGRAEQGRPGNSGRPANNVRRPAYLPGHGPGVTTTQPNHPAPTGGVRAPQRAPAFRPPPARAPVHRPTPPRPRAPSFHPAPHPVFHSAPPREFHPARLPAARPAPAGHGRR